MMAPIMIPDDNCKKNWNNKKETPTNQIIILLGLCEGVEFNTIIRCV